MSISFRTRLFGGACVIVAATLAGVMVLGWSGLLEYQIKRLDERLCMEARRLATQPVAGNDMNRLETDIQVRLRLATVDQLLFKVDLPGGQRALQSSRWPDAMDSRELNWSRNEMPDDTRGARPGGREPPPGEPPPHSADGGPPTAPAGEFSGLSARPEPAPGPRGGFRPDRPPPGRCALASFTYQNSGWRAARVDMPGAQSFLAADLAATQSEIQGAMKQALTLMIPLALVLTALGAWVLSTLTLRPVNRLREAMRSVTQVALDQRLESGGEDHEFKDLIDAYNVMLERLQQSFQQASRFSADAAHELKTPLTILQGRLEQAIKKSEHRAVQVDLTQLLDEVARLSAITRKLLLLSQADAGHLALHLERVDLTELLDALLQDMQMMVTDTSLRGDIARGLVLRADATLLKQLLNNLVSNAIRYGRAGCWIRIQASAAPGGVDIQIANATRPLAGGERQRFFDRFYRGDSSRTRGISDPTDGTGLGLSLAREIARAHGGEVTLEPGPDDEVTMRLTLPAG